MVVVVGSEGVGGREEKDGVDQGEGSPFSSIEPTRRNKRMGRKRGVAFLNYKKTGK